MKKNTYLILGWILTLLISIIWTYENPEKIKSVKNKLGLKPNTSRVDKAVNYLIENPTLKYALILLGIFIAIFLLKN